MPEQEGLAVSEKEFGTMQRAVEKANTDTRVPIHRTNDTIVFSLGYDVTII